MRLPKQQFIAIVISALAVSVSAGQDKVPQIKTKASQLDFLIGDELVTSYRLGELAKPIFWPMNAPGGVTVTRAWPNERAVKGESTDHPHQKSAWFCHGDVIAEGIDAK